LAALDCVDYVVLFSESTPARLLSELKPDVLVKGADYTLDKVVGRDIVEGYGGRVELIPLVPGQSTSRLVRSIIEKYGQNR
jgi:D-beta-D-heptose 7-phosphate kinase/D-beta-D-heptose 1-phosphate adenosyltransferase